MASLIPRTFMFRFPNPASLPRRQWVVRHWLLRGEATASHRAGGTGKSTVGDPAALSLASGQPLLGKPFHGGPQAVWIFGLEDGIDELMRQLSPPAPIMVSGQPTEGTGCTSIAG